MAQRLDPGQLAELAQTIKGLSDEELAAQMKGLGGPDAVIKPIFEGMEAAFDPSRAQGVTATLQYDITTDEGLKQWTVKIADGKCETSEGPAEDPRLTLEVGLVDFVRLIFGQAEGPQLFMSGKLRLKGDMMFAMQMQAFFKRDFLNA